MRLLLCFFGAALLRGQQPAVETAAQTVLRFEQPLADLARQWIRDPLPLRKAWAAKISSQTSDPWFDAELIRALGDIKQLQGSDADEHKMRLAVLDALIQRASGIPEDLGLSLLTAYPAQAIILLYGRGCPHLATSIEIMRGAVADAVWLVAAGCLAQQAGGPVELLQRAEVKVQIEVFDAERRRIIGGTPGGVLGGIVSPFSPWPAEAGYSLAVDRTAQSGSILLSGGPHSVYFARKLGVALWKQSDDSWNRGDRSQYALDLLASQVGVTPAGLPLSPVTVSARLRWLTPEQGRTDLLALAAEQRGRYDDLISGLMRRNLLTPLERTRCPQSPEIGVNDNRGNRSQPLPSVAAARLLP